MFESDLLRESRSDGLKRIFVLYFHLKNSEHRHYAQKVFEYHYRCSDDLVKFQQNSLVGCLSRFRSYIRRDQESIFKSLTFHIRTFSFVDRNQYCNECWSCHVFFVFRLKGQKSHECIMEIVCSG